MWRIVVVASELENISVFSANDMVLSNLVVLLYLLNQCVEYSASLLDLQNANKKSWVLLVNNEYIVNGKCFLSEMILHYWDDVMRKDICEIGTLYLHVILIHTRVEKYNLVPTFMQQIHPRFFKNWRKRILQCKVFNAVRDKRQYNSINRLHTYIRMSIVYTI